MWFQQSYRIVCKRRIKNNHIPTEISFLSFETDKYKTRKNNREICEYILQFEHVEVYLPHIGCATQGITLNNINLARED